MIPITVFLFKVSHKVDLSPNFMLRWLLSYNIDIIYVKRLDKRIITATKEGSTLCRIRMTKSQLHTACIKSRVRKPVSTYEQLYKVRMIKLIFKELIKLGEIEDITVRLVQL